MRPLIIAIYGKANSGKTTTIKEISNSIKIKYDPVIETIGNLSKDILEILKLKNFTIGICSQGDPGGHLDDKIPKLEIQKPDLIICATRTRGATCDYIENKTNKYDVEWIKISYVKKNTKAPKMEIVNEVMGIISEVYKVC